MRRQRFDSETELAGTTADWLRSQGWSVYEEVCCQGRAADIVAVQGQLVWVVEAKQSLTFSLLEQARAWKPYAHYVSVTVPAARDSSGRELAISTAAWLGLGVLEVRKGAGRDRDPKQGATRAYGYFVREYPSPLFRAATRRVSVLREHLVPGQMTGEYRAGTDGNRLTVFSQSAQKIRAYLVDFPEGVTPSALVRKLGSLHYKSVASAKGAIRQRAFQKLIPGVEARMVKGRTLLFPTGEQPGHQG